MIRELEFWKLNLKIGVLEIKFEINWNFENDLRIRVLNIKFKNWSFGNWNWNLKFSKIKLWYQNMKK